jgi:PAS domain S-box-containing protein
MLDPPALRDWPPGDGAMARRIRTFDWASTPLGPVTGWSQSLRTIVDLMLASPSMMSLVWGADAIHLYNDKFTELLREHHTQALGRSAFETFARSRNVFEDEVAAGLAGKSARLLAQRYPVLRNGRLEDAWFDVDYAPVRIESGQVGGVLWTLKEVTTQVLAEKALGESETRHRLLIESWAQAVWESDAGGVIVADSPSWRAYTGQTLEEWLGYGWLDAIHPEDRVFAERQWRDAIAARGLINAEFRLHAPSGGWRWTNVRAAPILDEEGKIEKWVGLNIDIDAGKRIEAALRESEERLRSFGEASQDVLWIRDSETLAWTYLTPAFETIYGVSREEALSGNSFRNWLGLIVPEDRARAQANIERVLAGEQVTFEYRVRRPHDGSIRWLRNTDFPMRDEDGQITSFGGIGQDVTFFKIAEEDLKTSEERLRSAAKVAQFAMWDWNIPTNEIAWSDEHFLMEGYAVGEVTPSYEAWAARIHPDDRAETEAALIRARDTHTEYVREFRSLHPDGSVHWLSGRGRFFYDESNQPVRMVGAMLEVTERREWEERQKVLVAELQHRTRNLMGVVRSMAEKTSRASIDLSDFRARFRDRLEALSRVQGLLSRLNDVDRVSFDDLIRTELAAMDGSSERVSLEGPSGVRLRSSTVQTLAMALHELATNAVKYGALGQPQGKLTVRWWLDLLGGDDKPLLHIDWRESGVQMPSAASPQGTGQGRELIERALPYQLKAKTSYSFGPDGVHCIISVPVSSSNTEVEDDA